MKQKNKSHIHIRIDSELKEEFLSILKKKHGGYLPHGTIGNVVEALIQIYVLDQKKKKDDT